MRCATCNDYIGSTAGVAYEITAWSMDRKGGGTKNQLWPKKTGRVMCAGCVVDKKYGIEHKVDPNQTNILDALAET